MPATTQVQASSRQSTTAAGPAPQGKGQVVPVVPFTRASIRHVEPFLDVSQQIGTSQVGMGPYDIPAYGYLDEVILQVDATGGSGGAANVAFAEDGPWTALQNLQLLDVNGAPIVGPNLTGYDIRLVEKYIYGRIPEFRPGYSAVSGSGASGNFSFVLRIPVGINLRDALGALPNLNRDVPYKLSFTIGQNTDIYQTAPATTLPTVRVRGVAVQWSRPAPTDMQGAAQATDPPAVNTTQFLSKVVINVPAGAYVATLPRVGNYVRGIIFVSRRSGSRANGDADFPQNATLSLDSQVIRQFPTTNIWKVLVNDSAYQPRGAAVGDYVEAGVYPFVFTDSLDGRYNGNELTDSWLPTSKASRLELSGSWANANTLTVITCDVIPAGSIYV